MNLKQQRKRMAAIFNEWAKRYAKNPSEFSNVLDDNGSPVNGYGEKCAIYFWQLGNEMDTTGLLPKPAPTL